MRRPRVCHQRNLTPNRTVDTIEKVCVDSRQSCIRCAVIFTERRRIIVPVQGKGHAASTIILDDLLWGRKAGARSFVRGPCSTRRRCEMRAATLLKFLAQNVDCAMIRDDSERVVRRLLSQCHGRHASAWTRSIARRAILGCSSAAVWKSSTTRTYLWRVDVAGLCPRSKAHGPEVEWKATASCTFPIDAWVPTPIRTERGNDVSSLNEVLANNWDVLTLFRRFGPSSPLQQSFQQTSGWPAMSPPW